jgi:hypothetical protein
MSCSDGGLTQGFVCGDSFTDAFPCQCLCWGPISCHRRDRSAYCEYSRTRFDLTLTGLIQGASVFLLHENQEPNLDTLKFLPHLKSCFGQDPEKLSDTSKPICISLNFLAAFHPETVTLNPPTEGPLYERKLNSYNRERKIHEIWKEISFDGFLSVSSYDPMSYLPLCIEKVDLSGNIAVYNQYREVILELQNFVLTKLPMRPILAPQIHEVRAIRWSTPKGRTRPDMIGRGGGGFLLSGIRVEEELIDSRDRNEERKKRKRETDENNGDDLIEDMVSTD